MQVQSRRFLLLLHHQPFTQMITAAVYALLLAATPAQPQGDAPQQEELPGNLRRDYVQMADSADWYIAREMWVDAKRCTVDALRRDPSNFNNALLLSNLGIINTHLGDVEEAVSNFTLGLSIAPASTTLRANRARAYLSLGQYGDAYDDLAAILEADPGNDWARKMYGVTCLARGNSEEALAQFRKIEEPDADTLRMMAQIAAGNNDTDYARTLYDRLVETSPGEESYFDRALFLISTEEYQLAGDDIREGLKLSPRNGDLLLLRAYIHSVMHENEMAEMDKKLAAEYGADTKLFNTLFPTPRKRK